MDCQPLEGLPRRSRNRKFGPAMHPHPFNILTIVTSLFPTEARPKSSALWSARTPIRLPTLTAPGLGTISLTTTLRIISLAARTKSLSKPLRSLVLPARSSSALLNLPTAPPRLPVATPTPLPPATLLPPPMLPSKALSRPGARASSSLTSTATASPSTRAPS